MSKSLSQEKVYVLLKETNSLSQEKSVCSFKREHEVKKSNVFGATTTSMCPQSAVLSNKDSSDNNKVWLGVWQGFKTDSAKRCKISHLCGFQLGG
jgi:hypothetical protein